ncbi:protein atonal homolog 8 [Exaiptasia diaphana]|uniref:BHLH domain-containing protein n=1 Tax=Exaiptasia diaphana TaxID=2652724 RepID=A0A913WZJ1_EXADI|nr:protein atonal homolog 8 [Exaiptasia diaphana]
MDIPLEDSNTSEESNTEGVATKRSKNTGSQSGKKKRDKSKRAVSWRHSSRSRRLIANARERSRIHIMSEAFDCLRRAVPCYSHDQKLSKLAILRLATSYISALAHLNHLYESESDSSLKLFADCVDECTRALQTEGRTKRKE